MCLEGKPLIFLALQLLLLFGGTRVSSLNSNEPTISRGDANEFPCPKECICTSPPTDEEQVQSVPIPLPTVTCSGRNLTSIPDGIWPSVRKLDLSSNNISWINPDKLNQLKNLHILSLMSNLIEEINSSAFYKLSELKELTLSRNQLTLFPTGAIPSHLELLNLEYNRITHLKDRILPNNSRIRVLFLGHNRIEKIDERAFEGLDALELLELDGNRLIEIPMALGKLTNLQELSLTNNRITRVDVPFHQIIPRVRSLEVRGNPMQFVHPEGFSHLLHLKKLILSNVKNLTEFPDLNGTTSLEILRIDRCSIHTLPVNLCTLAPKLKSLDLKSNKLRQLPVLEQCSELKILELGINDIEDLGEGAFENLTELHDLHLHKNRVTKLTAATFRGLVNLRNLDLSYNDIDDIHPETFFKTPKLEDLNLGNNFFHEMPSKGLGQIKELKTFNNPNLREFPGPESFPKVRRLVLSYAYHCCQFVSTGSAPTFSKSLFDQSSVKDEILYPTDQDFHKALAAMNLSESYSGFVNLTNKAELGSNFWETFGTTFTTDTSYLEDGSLDETAIGKFKRPGLHDISCIPLPGPFLPCNDLFDWWTLRCGVWIVFLLALMGNGTVVFVQIFARTKMDVPRFLVCNLAVADFFMGVYLGFLAVIDAATLGEFRKYAIPWQLSSACQVAGFLGVLSSELSVFTLTVITLERHYVITHAMHLNKRLSLKHASYIMMLGWVFATLMATLPLFGVSDYRKFAVCLPFETGDGVSLGYVVFLMFANGVAFTILMSCYVKMYCSIRGSAAWNSNETRIAKNMALLVFTDLLCWFPIAFFSLTAAFGLQLVSLEEAKVFTVFILPLNSCCNPFLYAILTKQFKKDCVLICKAIEESRVTRGIGRCRHSSNFSNRQTAPNTGSLTDKVSKDGQPCICHSGLHPGGDDVNGNAKYRFVPAPERLTRFGPFGRFFSRYIFCQNNGKDANRQRDDHRMQNVRRYLYNTATANYPPDGQKHQRHPSVSSDNFSSSRSDSWRVQNRCGIPLRLLEPRRRNSWAVTRKPSQDSNLSSSRNDSSATSNSTATWRLSRSSVSSDATSHSGGGKSSFKRISTNTGGGGVAAMSNQVTTTATVNRPKNLPGTAASAAAVIATGSSGTMIPSSVMQGSTINPSVITEDEIICRTSPSGQVSSQSQVQPPSSCLQRRPSIPKTVTISDNNIKRKGKRKKGTGGNVRRSVRKKADSDVIIIDDDEASAKIATNRPRLVRQSAFFSEEVVIEPEVCPVHGPLNRGTYDDEDDEEEEAVSDIDELEEGDEENESGDGESDGENSSPTDPILRKPSGQIGIALVIVPRRLSTISSRDTLSIRSREENDLLNDGNCSSVNSNNNLNPSSSSPLPSSSTINNSNSPTALLLPQGAAGGLGRRKMSEQPVQFFVVPTSSGLVNSTKWHSMSSVESAHQSNQPSQAQAQFISSPSQSRSHSRSQSPRGFMKPDSQRMTAMAENQEEFRQEPSFSQIDMEKVDLINSSATSDITNSIAKKFGFRDPNERRVSFQLPAVTVALPGAKNSPDNSTGESLS